jgi:hypothetical protein
MASENFLIEIDGQEITELYPDLLRLEVELDDELASMFRLQIALKLQPDGVWSYLDDERFQVWKEVRVSAGYDEGVEELIIGYITHIRPKFVPDLQSSTMRRFPPSFSGRPISDS